MKNVMRNRFRDSEKSQLVFINIVTILSLLLVIFPLLLIAKYNRPSADDWGYGTNGYHALMSGGNIFDVLKASMKTAQQAYLGWDGRFANDFWDSLQPGIWGEKYYGIVAWLLISMLILTEIFFCRYFIFAKIKKEENRWVYLPIIVPILIMQILYCPSPVESFYWYTGGMNYTFAFSLWLVLFTIYVKLGTSAYTVWWKRWIVCIAAGLLAGLIGGSNFATSLSAVLSLFLVTGVCALQKKKAFIYKTFYIPFIMVVSLLISVFSAGGRAGNANRIIETGGAVHAILMSLVRSATNIYSWTNTRILLMLFLILPFIWMAVKNMEIRFRYPLLFTFLTFGVYASQAAPTMYVDGTTGGGRMAAILYYSYMIWLVGNVVYWAGWLCRRTGRFREYLDKTVEKLKKYLVVYCGIVGVILAAVIYRFDLRDVSSYKAYRDWKQGWAEQYAKEWDERIEILRDDSVKKVEFQPLTVYPEMLLYTDLQPETGYIWVNSACAQYYGKEGVTITMP